MTRLTQGQQAPAFSTTDYQGHPIRFEEARGHAMLVSFFRAASCPFCNMRLHQLITRHQEFADKGIRVITFFASSAKEIQQYAGRQTPPFPIIPDEHLVIYRRYGVEEDKNGMLKTMLQAPKMLRMMVSGFFNLRSVSERPVVPADFLIGSDLRIIEAHYGKDFGDHLPLDDVLTAAHGA